MKTQRVKTQGTIGENNHGYVEVLGMTLWQVVADAENNDRKTIYQTIALQNGLQDAIETIEKSLPVQRDKAMPGDKIQEDDGRWVTK